MEKNFKQYMEAVNGCNTLFSNSVQEKQDEVNKLIADWRYSEKGKQEKRDELYKDLNATAENMTKVFKEGVTRFLADFRVVLPDDGKDHSKDVENGLRIIEMLGFGLDVKNLDNIMRPLRQSYASMKTIVDVIEAKNNRATNGSVASYDPAIISKLYDYMGINSRVTDYLELYAILEDLVNGQDKYRFSSSLYSNSPLTTIEPIIPYSFLACADWIEKAGTMYADLEGEFAALFKNHVPTDKEMIESVLQNQQ